VEGMRDENKTQTITGRRGTMLPPSECLKLSLRHHS
jgi:hypothetical protein